MRFASLALAGVACSGAMSRPDVAPPSGDLVRGAAQLELEGRFAEVVAHLQPHVAALDVQGLALLGRAEIAAGRTAEGRRILEDAVTRAEAGGRGAWSWQPGETDVASAIAFSRDGTRLVARNAGGIHIWDLATRRETARLDVERVGFHTDPLPFRMSPDGQQLVTAGTIDERAGGPGRDWRIAIHDASQPSKVLAEPPLIAPFEYAPDGRLVAIDASSRELVEYDVSAKRVVARYGKGFDDFAVDGTHIVTVTQRDAHALLVVWERGAAPKQIAHTEVDGRVWYVARMVNGELLVGRELETAGKLERRLVLVDPRIGAEVHTVAADAQQIALSPDRARVFVTAPSRPGRLVEIATRRTVREFETVRGPVAFHPGGKLIGSAGHAGFEVWNVETGARTAVWNAVATVHAVAFDADGRLGVATDSGVAMVWDLATGAQRPLVTPGPVRQIAFGPEGELATASDGDASDSPDHVIVWRRDGTRAWSTDLALLRAIGYTPTGELATIAQRAGGGESSLDAWSRDGSSHKEIQYPAGAPMTWSHDGAYVHHTGAFPLLTQPRRGTRLLYGDGTLAAFESAGPRIALVERNGWVSVWDTSRDEPMAAFLDPGGEDQVRAVAWSRDGSLVATASRHSVRLWDPRTSIQLAELKASSTVTSVAFHPGGKLVAVGCAEGVVELWAVATASLVATLAVFAPDRTIVVAPDGAVDGTLAATDRLAWRAGAPHDPIVVPGLGAWERARSPGLLAARIAQLPDSKLPPVALRVEPTPPATCLSAAAHSPFVSEVRAAGSAIDLCLRGDSDPQRPTCFTFDVATGAYTARPAVLYEVMGVSPPRDVSARREGGSVEVCRRGTCSTIATPELDAMGFPFPGELGSGPGVAVNDDGSLLAVWDYGYIKDHTVSLYDVATGKVRRKIPVDKLDPDGGSGETHVRFAGPSLMVTPSVCTRGPCGHVLLVSTDGKLVGFVGGVAGADATGPTPARLYGDVYAFADFKGTVVYQNVRTGRVVGRTRLGEDRAVATIAVPNGIALVNTGGDRAGDITLVDQRGTIISSHRLPICR